MQQSSGTGRGIRRAALVLAAGLGPGAVVLPLAAGAAIYVDPATAVVEDRAAVQRLVVAEAVRNGVVPAPLALAVVEVESEFVPRTVGTSGAIGLMQILPAVAEREFAANADALWEPVTNLRMGLGRLARLHDRYDGDWELALSHFRGGELRREAGRYVAHGYTLGYVERVMRGWRRYQRDPLVRAWIRGARGVPRFVAADALPRFETRSALATPPIRWESAADSTRPRHHLRGHHHRLTDRCDETHAARRPAGYRFGRSGGSGGRWTAIEGAPSPALRFRDGRWVAVTGGPRFR
ncbi:MAG: transglycosylase SLT domain-containing protein [Immundisolibacterales bacterium]|nr:transglycosylase SLT domain-containing protein [Immundisolibacterales bacterium]